MEYEITKEGEVINNRGRKLSPYLTGKGYLYVCINGKSVSVHRLVAVKYISNPMALPCVNHKDGDKTNNHVDNLEWCTYSQNSTHSYQLGLSKIKLGEDTSNAVLSESLVKEIKSTFVKGSRTNGASALARKFNVGITTVHDIVTGKTWRHI